MKEASITDRTFYRWRKEYGGLQTEQARKLKQLQKENVEPPKRSLFGDFFSSRFATALEMSALYVCPFRPWTDQGSMKG